MKLNDEYIVNIIDCDENGNGIAKINNFVIFINGCLLNERVKIKLVEINKHYAIGQLLEVLLTNEDRNNVNCLYYNSCGGCSFLHLSPQKELLLKENKIKNMFPDYLIKPIVFDNNYNYRNKVVFHIKDNKIGFYQENTNNIIEIDSCLLVDSNINMIIKEIKTINYSNLNEILIRSTNYTKEILLSLNGDISLDDLNKLSSISSIKSIYLNDELIYGKAYITEIINDIKYTIYPNSFFQVNTLCMIKLYDKVKEYAQTGNNLLDLYCGTGTIGIYLSNNFKNVLGIEVVKSSIDNAFLNKKINNITNIDFKCLDVVKLKEKNFDVIVVDPPRSGLNKIVIKKVIDINPKRIVYVSCNPNTLKKDLKLLECNYNVSEITPFNMFYRTKHVECVCVLNRIK